MLATYGRGTLAPFFIKDYFAAHDPARGSGQACFEKNPRVESGEVRTCFEISRFGSGRVALTRPDPTRAINDPTREMRCTFFHGVSSLAACCGSRRVLR